MVSSDTPYLRHYLPVNRLELVEVVKSHSIFMTVPLEAPLCSHTEEPVRTDSKFIWFDGIKGPKYNISNLSAKIGKTENQQYYPPSPLRSCPPL